MYIYVCICIYVYMYIRTYLAGLPLRGPRRAALPPAPRTGGPAAPAPGAGPAPAPAPPIGHRG